MKRIWIIGVCIAALATAIGAGWWTEFFQSSTAAESQRRPERVIGRMVEIPGGTFRMGNDLSSELDQRPAHEVSLDAFKMDEHEVTNGQFARFVEQTGYVTSAEQNGWSFVFDEKDQSWQECTGADWRHPTGPDSSITGREDYPVVHVSWYDAKAYANWAGKALPTEAEWERAARSGLRDANYPWGRDEMTDGRYLANYRQHGQSPTADGFERAAPVKSYPPSPFGLYDICGNVWEWCRDWYGADYYQTGVVESPSGPSEGSKRVIRGGSWLSPENFRPGHHVSTRESRRPEHSFQNVGFRCVDRSPSKRY